MVIWNFLHRGQLNPESWRISPVIKVWLKSQGGASPISYPTWRILLKEHQVLQLIKCCHYLCKLDHIIPVLKLRKIAL